MIQVAMIRQIHTIHTTHTKIITTMIGKKIYLIGYMGCGKTYTGRRISDKYGLQFIDLDAYIEKRQFKTIPQLFQPLHPPLKC